MSNELKAAKREYKAAKLKNEKYRETRNNTVSQILRTDIPNWGGIIVKFLNN